MAVLFKRIRGRAAGHVVAVNPLLVRELQPTSWGGTEIVFTDLHVTVSRDNPLTVQSLLEGRVRLCQTPLCDRDTVDPYTPVCARCRDRSSHAEMTKTSHRETFSSAQDLVVVNGKH